MPTRGAAPLNYKIARMDTMSALESYVSGLRENGWHAVGSPFYETFSRRWCQAVERKPEPLDNNGTIALKEERKKKSPKDCHFSVG